MTTGDQRGEWPDRVCVQPTRLDLTTIFVGLTAVYTALVLAIDPSRPAAAVLVGGTSGLISANGLFERAKQNRGRLVGRSRSDQLAIYCAVRRGVAAEDPQLDADVRLLIGLRRMRQPLRLVGLVVVVLCVGFVGAALVTSHPGWTVVPGALLIGTVVDGALRRRAADWLARLERQLDERAAYAPGSSRT